MTLACPTRSSAKAVFDINVSIRTAAIRHMLITLQRQLSNVAWIEFRPILKRLQGRQIRGPLGIVKLGSAQPASLETSPEQDGIHPPERRDMGSRRTSMVRHRAGKDPVAASCIRGCVRLPCLQTIEMTYITEFISIFV